MARKKKNEEHENLERWLVSYADFMTLLFATFVVLYALSQVDIASYEKLEQSIKNAFSSKILQGRDAILEDSGENVIGQGTVNNGIDSIMLEFLSQKYEQDSFEQIKESIEKMVKDKYLEGVEVSIDSRGLVIRLKDNNINFEPASAKLTKEAKSKIDKIASLIGQKFVLHLIKVEGHTDDIPFSNLFFPSNWELSACRSTSIVRYMIDRFKFMPDLFIPIGYGSTRPLDRNNTQMARKLNRRTEILVLRNKFTNFENVPREIMKKTKEEQQKIRQDQLKAINKVLNIYVPQKQNIDNTVLDGVQKNDTNSFINDFESKDYIFDDKKIDSNLYESEVLRLKMKSNNSNFFKPDQVDYFR